MNSQHDGIENVPVDKCKKKLLVVEIFFKSHKWSQVYITTLSVLPMAGNLAVWQPAFANAKLKSAGTSYTVACISTPTHVSYSMCCTLALTFTSLYILFRPPC